MKLKVIENIGALVEGDVLEYNDKDEEFFLEKTEEVLDEKKKRTRTRKVTVSYWFAKNNTKYFAFIDDKGKELILDTVNYENLPQEPEVSTDIDKVEKKGEPILTPEEVLLKQENKELKQEVEKLNKEIDLLKYSKEIGFPRISYRILKPIFEW
jgi:hypothetical protein